MIFFKREKVKNIRAPDRPPAWRPPAAAGHEKRPTQDGSAYIFTNADFPAPGFRNGLQIREEGHISLPDPFRGIEQPFTQRTMRPSMILAHITYVNLFLVPFPYSFRAGHIAPPFHKSNR